MKGDYAIVIDIKRTGKKIKKVCDLKGINVKTIQEKLHIGAFQSVYNWFSGKTLPSLDNLYELCKLLGVSMESLIVETESLRPEILFFEMIDRKTAEAECRERVYHYSQAISRAV